MNKIRRVFPVLQFITVNTHINSIYMLKLRTNVYTLQCTLHECKISNVPNIHIFKKQRFAKMFEEFGKIYEPIFSTMGISKIPMRGRAVLEKIPKLS